MKCFFGGRGEGLYLYQKDSLLIFTWDFVRCDLCFPMNVLALTPSVFIQALIVNNLFTESPFDTFNQVFFVWTKLFLKMRSMPKMAKREVNC